MADSEQSRSRPMQAASPARVAAFRVLQRVNRKQEHADALLRELASESMHAHDLDLATALVMGVLRWQIRLDTWIRQQLTRPGARLDAPVQVALRLGVFQLKFMDRIPVHAAIHDSVTLCRMAGHGHASRMVNAVLRRLATAPHHEAETMQLAGNAAELAERSAHPAWLVERWVQAFGLEQARWLCEHGQQPPQQTLRLTDVAARSELAAMQIGLEPSLLLSAACKLQMGESALTRIRQSEAWKSGRIRSQDEGSQLVAEIAGHGRRILDFCAAPGGKTMILAERNPGATVDACEVSPARAEAMRSRLRAMQQLPWSQQITVHTVDAATWAGERQWDIVLVDAPCSGTGTIGRNPEIRHRLQPQEFARQAQRQTELLKAAMHASSRRVVYSTCSLEREENEDVVRAALDGQSLWRQVSAAGAIAELLTEGRITTSGVEWLRRGLQADGSLRICTRPDAHGSLIRTDGFYLAILERNA